MIAQIAAWWVPLSIGAAFGLFIMAIIAAGKIDRMKGKHLKERESHLEIIEAQGRQITALRKKRDGEQPTKDGLKP